MYTRLPNQLLRACEDAITFAARSKSFVEHDAEVHPLVGAVILDERGKRLSTKGARREDGRNHAEVVAIQSLTAKKRNRVHTVVTTLEPCCYRTHHDQICCAKRIVRLGAKQVLIGSLDPATSVRGRGAQILQMRGVYFTMFPKKLCDRVKSINQEYIEMESELYRRGARPRRRAGILTDDMEFSLKHAPPKVRRFLRGPKFKRLMRQSYQEFRNKKMGRLGFERFFAIRAMSVGSTIPRMIESGSYPTIFNLIADYMAIPPFDPKIERSTVYQCLAEWWDLNQH